MTQEIITARTRRTGTGAARACRRQGLVPGIVYGKGIEPVPVALSVSELRKMLARGMSHIHRLKIEDTDFEDTVMVQAVDRDPFTGEVIHIDVHRISLKEEVRVDVPVVLVGEEAINSRGLVLQRQAREVTVECLPTDIPEMITVDVSHMSVGDTLYAGDLPIPEKVRLVTEAEEIIAVVVAPSVGGEKAAEGEATEEAPEGEQ